MQDSNPTLWRMVVMFLACVWATLGVSPGVAQDKQFGKDLKGADFEGLKLPTVKSPSSAPALQGLGAGQTAKVEYQAQYEIKQGTQQGRLTVTATLAAGYHTYSTTQPPGGPLPTEIILKGDAVQLSGPFVADRGPKIGSDEIAYPKLPLEEYYGSVSWTAPIKFTQGFDPKSTTLSVLVDALVCSQACEPVNAELEAKFHGYYGGTQSSPTQSIATPSEPPPQIQSFRVPRTHAVWSAQLKPASIRPGASGTIELTAVNDPGYHVYEYVPNDAETNFRTLIVAKTKSGLQFGTPATDAHLEPYPGLEYVKYYGGEVTWRIPVHVPTTASQGEFPIELAIGFMTCNEGSCDEPSGLTVTGTVTVGQQSSQLAAPLLVASTSFKSVVQLPMLASWIDDTLPEVAVANAADAKGADTASVDAQDRAAMQASTQGLTLVHILAGLAGGFILNFMPCVLPVIGLKVMSFVNQAGSTHGRVVSLNLAYVGGILAVMLILAIATILAQVVWGKAFGWGEQFTVLEFKVALACLVFAMALSFLGVWEIPIPGFATSGKSGELMAKEGLIGAFLKGMLTTVLATPCSGPLLGALFGLSLVLSPFHVILLYLIVGLGMALPFLVLCIYPGFINMLPKPGAWMETLKQVLAFPLLLTVVFFVTSIDDGHRIATLILLVVVWFACWLVGRVPSYADSSQVRRTWLAGIAVIAVGTVISFTYFGPLHTDLKWVPYEEAQLAKYRAEGKTVMLDFTANWCLVCQTNTRVAIDRERVARLVEKNAVVPMLADWTDRSEEIRTKLNELQSNSIPLLVIYPPNPESEPILLRDALTESRVLEALEQAGPSRQSSQLVSTTVD